jgi:uncharacterized protein YycO
MIKLLFSRRKHIGSWIIRKISWSEWSHVEIIMPTDILFGSAAPHGVSFYSMNERLNKASRAAVMSFPGDFDAAFLWGKTQIGRPYDYLGVLGIGFHRDWEDDHSWWCSEFAAQFLKQGGFEPYRHEAIKRLSPEHLFMLNQSFEIIKG